MDLQVSWLNEGLIRSAFDAKYISKAGEVHAVDFDYSSKSQRKLAKAILLS